MLTSKSILAIVTALRFSSNRDDINALNEMTSFVKGRDLKVGDVIMCPGARKPVIVLEIDNNIVKTTSEHKYNGFYLGNNDQIGVYRA